MYNTGPYCTTPNMPCVNNKLSILTILAHEKLCPVSSKTTIFHELHNFVPNHYDVPAIMFQVSESFQTSPYLRKKLGPKFGQPLFSLHKHRNHMQSSHAKSPIINSAATQTSERPNSWPEIPPSSTRSLPRPHRYKQGLPRARCTRATVACCRGASLCGRLRCTHRRG